MPEVHGRGGRGGARAAAAETAVAWAWVALWLLVVLQLSSGAFSAEWSRRGIGPLILILGLTREQADLVHFLVRKGAHLFEYGVLGFLAFRAAALSWAGPRAAALAFALCALVAVTDEASQATRPTRTGTPRDVALDLAGAALGLAARRGAQALAGAPAAPEAA